MNIIGHEQNSRLLGGAGYVAKDATNGCDGCAFFNDVFRCRIAWMDKLCQPDQRQDGRRIVWLPSGSERLPTDSPVGIEVGALQLNPGDVVIVRTKQHLKPEQVGAIYAQLSRVKLPHGAQWLVIHSGLELSAITGAPTATND